MSELEARSEPLTPDPELPKAVDDLGRISELLSGDRAPQPEDEADAPEPEQQPEQPPEMDEPPLAAADEPEPEPPAVDYDQVVPMPDDQETVTVGQLKDYYRAKGDHEKERETWEDNRIAEDGRLQVARAELNQLANLMGNNATPELIEHLKTQRTAGQKREQDALIALYPEWSDPDVKRAASPALLKTAQFLGMSEGEYAQIGDHRLIHGLKLLSTYMERAEKAKAALEAKPTLPKVTKAATKRKQSEAQQRRQKIARAKTGSDDDKMSAISSLIRG